MSQLFYKYIIDELLADYFGYKKLQSGSRYYIIIDNDQNRKDFLTALQNSVYSKVFTITEIYKGIKNWRSEDTYTTSVFQPNEDALPLIIGNSSTATDDYLTTLRNSVGANGSNYENYGILYVLSNNKLESLTTTSVNLQDEGLPLNSNSIKNSLDQKINESIVNDYERIYLRDHLERLADKIGDGSYSLFDYKEILSILSKHTLKGAFVSLGYFEDDEVYNILPGSEANEFKRRVSLNASCYSKIEDIFTHMDGEERISNLSKFLDDKFSEKLAYVEDFRETSFEDILRSTEKKEASAVLAFDNCRVDLDNNDSIKLIKRIIGNQKKKSNVFILIGDVTNREYLPFRLSFETDITKLASVGKVNGRYLKLNLPYGLTYVEVGKDNNIHKFFIKRMNVDISVLSELSPYFKILKRDVISVEIPSEVTHLKIGKGDYNVELSSVEKIEWKDNYQMNIPLDSSEEKLNFSLLFNGKEERFEFKFNNNRMVPKLPLKIFELVWTKKAVLYDAIPNQIGERSFSKLRYEEEEFLVYDNFRQYLCWEKKMIMSEAFSMSINNKGLCTSEYVDIPDSVKSSLLKIYTYFKENDTVPSLCYIDNELADLYSGYLQSIYMIICSIPENRTMHSKELELTKLGVIEYGDLIMFSPFHPLMVAFLMGFREMYDHEPLHTNLWKLISPFYLMPYIFYNSKPMRPYVDSDTEGIKTWLCYESVNNKAQIKTYDITSKMVYSKLTSFLAHFNYLFQDLNSPIIISTIGIVDDTYVIKGIIGFIKEQYSKKGVQRIEIHEYVDDLLKETFFEKLNRLNSDELICAELNLIGVDLEKKDLYSSREIIRQLFTRVSFYKHDLKECDNQVGYSHIAFYMMNPICAYVTPPSTDMRVELSMRGLISIPSTKNDGLAYNIGFGSQGLKMDGSIYQMIDAMNILYANARNNGRNQFQKNICVAKTFSYDSYDLLDSIYENSNWVTFLNPEVDINFFYQQKDVYIVHYTDQYTINAKYDSITVTKHVNQYENMLQMAYEKYTKGKINVECFNQTMKDYFNSLNGSWLLGIINKTELQIREKLSIVGACVIMRHFLNRIPNVLWIPISLEEILRVSGSIGLPKDESIFSAKLLGEKGSLSDDLLMMGLDIHDSKVRLLLYPVEVKVAKTGACTDKGEKQVCHTYQVLKDYLEERDGFVNDIYRTFFASQYLVNADKLHANALLTEDAYCTINKFRFDLLNLSYEMSTNIEQKEMGHAALVYFYANVKERMCTSFVENIPICHIDLTQKECFECVADPTHKLAHFLASEDIFISDDDLSRLNQASNDCSGDIVNVFDDVDNIKASDNIIPLTSYIIEQRINSKAADTDEYEEGEYVKEDKKPIQIILGTSNAVGEKIIFEPNNTQMVSHPNMGIIGTMGTGKTQLARSVIAQFSRETAHNVGKNPIGILVFDYKGDYKDKEFLDNVNGESFKINFPFNPLKLIIGTDTEGLNLPAITADRISNSFATAYGLGPVQQSTIKQLIIETYQDAGITSDPSTWVNPVPTIKDFINKYFENSKVNDSAYALLDKFRDYSIFEECNDRCVSLFEWLKGVKVIDLTLFPDDTKKVIVSLILDLFYAEMKQLGGSLQKDGMREIRAMILVDEAHQFLKKDFSSLRSIISEGRMFGVGMILSTQNIGDFRTSKEDYSSFILSWVIHHVNDMKRTELNTIFGNGNPYIDNYVDYITNAGLFESICKIGNKVIPIKDLPYFKLVEEDKRFQKE